MRRILAGGTAGVRGARCSIVSAVFIERVKIRNFRSIVDAEIDLADMTIFLGANDAGKSNFLRALNLFFNGMPDGSGPFTFAEDFSYGATVGKGKAREVWVELHMRPPTDYKSLGLVRWKKRWPPLSA